MKRRFLVGTSAAILLALPQHLLATVKSQKLDLTINCNPVKGPKSISLGDQKIDWVDGDEMDIRIRKAVGEDNPAIHIVTDIEMPWRCIAGVIFELQKAGISHIGFDAQPSASAKKGV